MDWYLNEFKKICKCSSFFDKNSEQECTLREIINCKSELITLKNLKPSETVCPKECVQIKYKVDIKFGYISKQYPPA